MLKVFVNRHAIVDIFGKFSELGFVGKFTVQQQVADFHVTGTLCELVNRITSIEQYSVVSIDISHI